MAARPHLSHGPHFPNRITSADRHLPVCGPWTEMFKWDPASAQMLGRGASHTCHVPGLLAFGEGIFDTFDTLLNLWDPIINKDTVQAPQGVCHKANYEGQC